MSQRGWRRSFVSSWSGFMGEWSSITLGELVENHSAARVPIKASERSVGKIPYFGASGVVDHVNGHTHDGSFLLVSEDGENLRSRSGPIAFNTSGKIWVNNHAHVLRGLHSYDTIFLKYALAVTDVSGYLTGSAQPKLNRAALESIRLEVPAADGRRAIAEVLGALDDKIATNERVNGASEALAVALVESAPRATRVSELATQSTQSVSPNGFDERVAHFSLPSFDDGGRPDLAAPSSIKSNKFLIERPAVLISKLNPRIPRVWDVVRMPDQMALASTEFVVLHPMGLSTTALWGALRQPSVTSTLAGKVAGTSGSHQRVNPAQVLQLRVPDPRTLDPRVLQRVDSLGGLIHAVRVESVRLAATRDELLPLLMSGRLRVKDAAKVVAGVV